MEHWSAQKFFPKSCGFCTELHVVWAHIGQEGCSMCRFGKHFVGDFADSKTFSERLVSVLSVELFYWARNVLSYTRCIMLHFLAFRDSPTITFRCSPCFKNQVKNVIMKMTDKTSNELWDKQSTQRQSVWGKICHKRGEHRGRRGITPGKETRRWVSQKEDGFFKYARREMPRSPPRDCFKTQSSDQIRGTYDRYIIPKNGNVLKRCNG